MIDLEKSGLAFLTRKCIFRPVAFYQGQLKRLGKCPAPPYAASNNLVGVTKAICSDHAARSCTDYAENLSR